MKRKAGSFSKKERRFTHHGLEQCSEKMSAASGKHGDKWRVENSVKT